LRKCQATLAHKTADSHG